MATIITPSLKATREAQGLTQQKLASDAGLSVAVISRIERGGGARSETLGKLGAVLGVRFTIGSSNTRRSQK